MSIAELGARQIFPRLAELRRPRGHQVFQCKWKLVDQHILLFQRFKLRVVNLEKFQMRRLKRLFDNPLYKCNFFNVTHVCSILSISFQFGEVPSGKIGAAKGKRLMQWVSLRSPTSLKFDLDFGWILDEEIGAAWKRKRLMRRSMQCLTFHSHPLPLNLRFQFESNLNALCYFLKKRLMMGSMQPIHPRFNWLVFNEVQFR